MLLWVIAVSDIKQVLGLACFWIKLPILCNRTINPFCNQSSLSVFPTHALTHCWCSPNTNTAATVETEVPVHPDLSKWTGLNLRERQLTSHTEAKSLKHSILVIATFLSSIRGNETFVTFVSRNPQQSKPLTDSAGEATPTNEKILSVREPG